jgi:hypothetical protein
VREIDEMLPHGSIIFSSQPKAIAFFINLFGEPCILCTNLHFMLRVLEISLVILHVGMAGACVHPLSALQM